MRRVILYAALLFLCVSCTPAPSKASAVAVAGTPETRTASPAPTVTPFPTDTPPPTTDTLPPDLTPTDTPAPVEGLPDPTEPINDVEPSPVPTLDADTDYDTADASEPPISTLPAVADLSNEKTGWYYNRNQDHQPPTAQRTIDLGVYGGYYLGDVTQKIVYLTFDEGYENGYTGTILDILQEKGVPAAFFMTKTYIRDNPELAGRIAAEGHVAANHSVKHISFPDLSDEEIEYELTEPARYYTEITGYPMDPFFRPPSGEYSERTLALTQYHGYQTVFWSFAYEDWLRDKQPGRDVAFNRVMDNLHSGEIILLHAVSESNTEALPDIIDAIRAQGYSFGTLYEISPQ